MKKFISLLLVCLMVVPFGMLAGMSVSAETAKTVYLSDSGDDANDGSTADKAVKEMLKAFELLGDNGGTVVVAGTYTHDAAFKAPAHTGKITIKGADSNALFHVTAAQRINFSGPIAIEELAFDVDANWSMLANYNDLTIAETVTVDRTGRTGSNPLFDTFIIGSHAGFATTDTPAKSYTLTINGGDWMDVVGSFWKDASDAATVAANYKDVEIVINVGGNAQINKLFAYGRSSKYYDPADGACTINLNGGKITHFICAHDNKNEDLGYANGLTININKGFDFAESFNTYTDENRISGDCYYGINGESAWTLDSIKNLEKSKLFIAAELYDSIKDSSKIRTDSFVSVEKAAADSGNDKGDKITLPAEPTLAADAPQVFIGHGGKGTKDGSSAANFQPTEGWDPVTYPGKTTMFDSIANGAKLVCAGKGYVGASPAIIAATSKPILITAVANDGTDYTSKTAGGDFDYISATGGNQGQIGMFMIYASSTVSGVTTFMGDVIFDDICLLDRTGPNATQATTYEVGSTGKMVITSTVTPLGMNNFTPALSVQEGGYLYLHALGFSSYTGKGTIVIGDEIIDDISEEMFAGFEGKIVDADGYEIDFTAADDDQGTNPDTSDMTWVVAVVAMIAVMSCGIVVLKKRA